MVTDRVDRKLNGGKQFQYRKLQEMKEKNVVESQRRKSGRAAPTRPPQPKKSQNHGVLIDLDSPPRQTPSSHQSAAPQSQNILDAPIESFRKLVFEFNELVLGLLLGVCDLGLKYVFERNFHKKEAIVQNFMLKFVSKYPIFTAK